MFYWTTILQSNNRGREIISKDLLDHSSTVLKAVSMVRRKRKVLGSMLCWFLSQSCNRIKENYTRKLGRPKAARSIRSMGPQIKQIKQIKEIKRSSVRRVICFSFRVIMKRIATWIFHEKKSMTSPWVISEPGHRAIWWDEKGPCQKVGISGIRTLGSEVIPKPTWKMPPFSNQKIIRKNMSDEKTSNLVNLVFFRIISWMCFGCGARMKYPNSRMLYRWIIKLSCPSAHA